MRFSSKVKRFDLRLRFFSNTNLNIEDTYNNNPRVSIVAPAIVVLFTTHRILETIHLKVLDVSSAV